MVSISKSSFAYVMEKWAQGTPKRPDPTEYSSNVIGDIVIEKMLNELELHGRRGAFELLYKIVREEGK